MKRPKPPRIKKPPRGTVLGPRQQRFVTEFMKDLNGTQAAIRAGYSERTAGVIAAENLTKPMIVAAIAAIQAERSKRIAIDADKVVTELAILSLSNESDFVLGENGRLTTAPGVPVEFMRAVSSVKYKRRTLKGYGPRGEDVTETEVEFRLWDKPATLRLIGQHLGMYVERRELTGKDGGPIEVEEVPADTLRERLARRMDGLAARRGAAPPAGGTNGARTNGARK